MNRNIRLLYLHNFLSDFRFQEAFLVIYFAQITGSFAMAMTVMGTATLTSALLDIPTGILSDKKGRRFTLVAASVCATLGVTSYALADGAAMLFVGAAFLGLAQCMFNGNNGALLYETLQSNGQADRFHHFMGRASSMYQLALCLSAMAATLLTANGLRLIFVLGIIPQAISIIVSLFFTEPKIHKALPQKNIAHLKNALLETVKNPRLRLLMTAQAMSYGAGEATFHFRSAYLAAIVSTNFVGFYRGLNHVFGFTGFWFAGAVIDRFKMARILIFRDVYWLATQSFAIWLSNAATPVILNTGALFFGPGEIASSKLMHAEFTDEQRASMASIGTFLSSLTYSIVALLIGLIADYYGVTAAFTCGLLLSLISLPINLRLFRQRL